MVIVTGALSQVICEQKKIHEEVSQVETLLGWSCTIGFPASSDTFFKLCRALRSAGHIRAKAILLLLLFAGFSAEFEESRIPETDGRGKLGLGRVRS